MELFFSFLCMGTLILLAVHLFDYAIEPRLRLVGPQFVSMPDHEVPPDDGPGWCDAAERYDQAA